MLYVKLSALALGLLAVVVCYFIFR